MKDGRDKGVAMSPAPFAAEVADGVADAEAWWVQTPDGVRLRVARLGRGPRGTVLLFPGRTEYVEKYGRAGRALAARGYGTAAIDWRGQGLSDRLLEDPGKGHVGAFRDYQQDVAALMRALPAMGLQPPCVLLAHSMGGAIGLRALFGEIDVAAAAFSAPMWGIELPPLLRPMARAIARVFVTLGLGQSYAPGTSAQSYMHTAPFAGNTLTHDPEVFAWMKAQIDACPGLSLGGPTMHWLHEALREGADLVDRPAPDVPCLTSLGSEEEVVAPTAIRRRMASWPGGELLDIPSARHEVMMETLEIREAFFHSICDFYDRHCPAPKP